MRKTKYTVKTTTLFKKDFKLAMKRGLNIELLENIFPWGNRFLKRTRTMP